VNTLSGGAVALVAAAILVLGWLVYPLGMRVAAALLPRRAPRAASPVDGWQTLAVVVATREAPERVAARVADLLATDYPPSRLEIVVAVDRDAPHPSAHYARELGLPDAAAASGGRASVRLVRATAAAGKAVALEAGVRATAAEIVAFADTAQTFAPDALRALVAYLADRRFGAVSGRLGTLHDRERVSVLGAFWSYETTLRRLEARLHSLPAVTGAIYAMRRSLWRTPPAGLICDDLYVPLSVVRAGYRVGYCEAACAYDPRSFTAEQELGRKIRTLTGMLQMCAWQPWILAPWRNPIWLQFVCHKLIRLATPLLVAVTAGGVALELVQTGWFGDVAGAAATGFGSALVALEVARPGAGRRLAARLEMAVRLLASPLAAMGHALRGDWNVWKPVRTPSGR
jgi:cellulose synthase/poly-beta-1,6-N-acetylglucosamine synthase-like glycosyltransferase